MILRKKINTRKGISKKEKSKKEKNLVRIRKNLHLES